MANEINELLRNHVKEKLGRGEVVASMTVTRTSGVIPASSAAMQIWPVVSSEKLACSRST